MGKVTIAELIDELSQYDPNNRVAYIYVTYEGRLKWLKNILKRGAKK